MTNKESFIAVFPSIVKIDNSIFNVEGPKQIYAQVPPIMASSSLSGMTFDYEMDLGVTIGMTTGSGYVEGPAYVKSMITVTGTLSGGATGDAGSYTSGAGGSGVIILRLLTADYSGSTTGSPTVTTSGSETILTYTGSGTYVHS